MSESIAIVRVEDGEWYPSMAAALRGLGYNGNFAGRISNAVRHGYRFAGYHWRRATDEETEVEQDRRCWTSEAQIEWYRVTRDVDGKLERRKRARLKKETREMFYWRTPR